ncbi:MAG: endolytic transglycosylase MltG [Eubacteriales bacterium]|nr:endolytic transglycosylase MltG [Eubacteriales bacterium]
MKQKKKSHPIVKGILLVLILAIFAGGFVFYTEYSRPSKKGKEIEVVIEEGSSTKKVIATLKEKGLINLQLPMYVKLARSPFRNKLRYGTFKLNDGMSLYEILETLATGGQDEDVIVVTIPEGYTAEMIASRLEENGVMNGQEFLDALKEKAKDFAEKDQLPDEKQVYYQLQGYLFPDTYHLDKDTTAEEFIDMMLDEFEKRFDESRRKKAKEMGYSITEVLTRASLVQMETDLISEYPTIAGVINNRLEKNMKLQFDSTVVYAMTEGKYGVARVMYSDLEYDSPYNTYQVKGLPAGPICNPSQEAIDSVLNPAEHNYLFFQTDTVKNDGSNLFFETYDEHLAASSTANRGEETKESEEMTTEKTEKSTVESGEKTDTKK